MKINSIKHLLYFLIIIILTIFFPKFEKLFFPDYSLRYVETNDYLLKTEEFSHIVVGNSHVTYSFIPNVFDEVSENSNSLNLSTYGAGIPSLYFYIKNAIDLDQKPEIILLEVFSFRYNEFDRSLTMLNNNKYINSIKDILLFTPYEKHNISISYLFGNYQWQNGLEYLNQNLNYLQKSQNIEKFERTLSKGFFKSKDLIDELSYNNAFQKGAYPIAFLEQKKIFSQIISICNENDIELILFRTPSINTMGLRDQYAEEIANNYSLLYIDLNKDILNEIRNPKMLYRDTIIENNGLVNSHTNYYGAIYTTLKLSDELSNLGYIEIDEEKYQEYWDKYLEIFNDEKK